nr:hypothetical protein [Acidaminococcus fermentans]
MAPINSRKNRRVAGYARVSTDHDDQVTSYAAQVDYYTNYIKEFDARLWGSLVDFITVYSKDDIRVTFKDGTEIRA